MKRLTNLHKPALLVFFFLWVVGLPAQKISKPKSDKWFKREAFKDFNHYYLGAQIGISAPMAYYDKLQYGQKTTHAGFTFSLTPSIPPNRVFAGYRYKRHSFEVGMEGKSFYSSTSSYDPQTFVYVIPHYGTYLSLGYMIDVMPKKSQVKVNLGVNLGPYFSAQTFGVSPVAGVNGMVILPVNQTFSLLFDFRYNIGFTQVTNGYGYYTSYSYRLMSMDLSFGFKVDLFNWTDTQKGLKIYEELKK